MKGRVEILRVHAKNKKLDTDVNLEEIAARTPGFSGADLANLLNEVRAIHPSFSCSNSFNCRVLQGSIDISECYELHAAWARRKPCRPAFIILQQYDYSLSAHWTAPNLWQRANELRWSVLQAAILTGRRSKTALTLKEVDDSVDRIVAGMEGTPMVDSKSKSLVAYHEVGHAVCATLTPGNFTGLCNEQVGNFSFVTLRTAE